MVATQEPLVQGGRTLAPRHRHAPVEYVWAAARISLGWIFLWAFLDKLFGFGHATPSARAWIHGGAPTKGFLANATGPFAGMFHNMAGNAVWDWLFMLGLAGIGTALILGVGMRIATVSGVFMLVLMWAAELPSANNIFMDDHIVYAIVLIGLLLVGAGRTLGLGNAWAGTTVVRRYRWLA
jgi:thiosulfate dehydrogenase [quinone] large subunit